MIIHSAQTIKDKFKEITREEINFKNFLKEDLVYFFTIASSKIKERVFKESQELFRDKKNFKERFDNLDFSKGPLKYLIYGFMEEIPYQDILSFVEKIFPSNKKDLMDIIKKACNRTAQLSIVADIEKRKNYPDAELNSAKWEDILSLFQSSISGLGTIKELFEHRCKILNNRNKITSKVTKYKRSYHFQDILNLQKNIEKCINEKEKTRTITELIEKKERVTELEFEYQEEEKKKCFLLIPNELYEDLEECFNKEKINTKSIIDEIEEAQCMIKIFTVIRQFSDHLLKKRLPESLSTLNSEQMVGLSFTILIAKMFNENIYYYGNKENLETLNEKCLMYKLIEEIEKSDFEDAKKILNCVELMKSNLYTTTKEDFINIFKTKEDSYDKENVKIKNIKEFL